MSSSAEKLEAVRGTIIEWLRRGHYRRVACAKVRISESTLNNWIQWGEHGKEPYATFLTDMLEAEADSQDELLRSIRYAKGGSSDPWTARAWIMERRWPKLWRGSVRLTVHEEVESMVEKLKGDADLYRRVVAKLANEETPNASVANADASTH